MANWKQLVDKEHIKVEKRTFHDIDYLIEFMFEAIDFIESTFSNEYD